MGYLLDRDLNKEYGFERERPGRDYLGGREKRDFGERETKGGKHVGDAGNEYTLGASNYVKRLEAASNSAAETAAKAAEAARDFAIRAAIKSAAAAAVKFILGTATFNPVVKGVVDVLLKPAPGPKHGEDMLPPDYWEHRKPKQDEEPIPNRLP